MDNLMMLALEAHCDEKNHHRRYEIVVGRDLLDDWTLTVRYGRVGTVGQERRYASADAQVIRSKIQECLRRRATATNRIGCSYRVTACDAVSEFDFVGWLPGELLQGDSVSRSHLLPIKRVG